jgi:hypothetical protein
MKESRQTDWRDSKGQDLEKTFRRVHFSNNDYKKARIEKNRSHAHEGRLLLYEPRNNPTR